MCRAIDEESTTTWNYSCIFLELKEGRSVSSAQENVCAHNLLSWGLQSRLSELAARNAFAGA
jgi:hypothetical protein